MVLVGSTSSKAILSHETSGLDDHQLHLQLFPVQIRSFLIVSQHRWSSSFFLRYYLQIAPVHKFSLGLYPWRMDDFFLFQFEYSTWQCRYALNEEWMKYFWFFIIIQDGNAGVLWMENGWNCFVSPFKIYSWWLCNFVWSEEEEWIKLLFTFLYANFGTLLQLVGTIVT
jgi:hypothetical protein